MKKYHYVIQEDIKTGNEILLGFNLSEKQAEALMYSLGKNKDSSEEDDLSNAYGCHSIRYTTAGEATKELITKPKKFNDALAVLNKAGYDVVQRGVVGKNLKVQSYQSEKKNIF